MFINKWLVSESIERLLDQKNNPGVCLSLDGGPIDNIKLYKTIQANLIQTTFAILISGEALIQSISNDLFAETIIRLFFQPNYYRVNYQPVLFLSRSNAATMAFVNSLAIKSSKQGLKDILVLETENTPFTYFVSDAGKIDVASLIRDWKNQNLSGKILPEINLLVPEKDENVNGVLNSLQNIQDQLSESDEYFTTAFLYSKQKEIAELRHQLYLKSISEKNTQLYLSIQKEERANGLKWYFNEYEILPKWYKKFGHILKVIMGKRSFKSLFSDKVKKYKD